MRDGAARRRGERPRDARERSVSIDVLRFGRLGDLVMVEPALRWLAATPGVRVRLVTDARYAGALGRAWPDVEVTSEVGTPDLVLDLHRVAASRRARRGHRWIGVAKEDVRRRLRIVAPDAAARWRPRWTWPERHLDAAARAMRTLGVVPGPTPSPRPAIAPRAPAEAGRLGLVLGAGHATKQWSPARFAALAAAWDGPVSVFAGPGEDALVGAYAAAAGGESAGPAPGALPGDLSLDGLIDGLSRCEVVVAGDTGPLHVAGALGRRVVGLFGPTPTDTGFWIWGGQGTALTPELPCAPCSLHGGAACPKRHHRCLGDLAPEVVFAAAEALARTHAAAPGRRGGGPARQGAARVAR